MHQAPHDALVALLFFLVKQGPVRLLVEEFGTVPRRVGWLAFRHSEALQDGLGVSLLRDGEGATLKVSLYLHAQDERHRSHVGHLETLLQLLFHHRHGVSADTGQKEIVHVEGQVDPNTVVIVQVDIRVGLKRNEADVDKGGINGVKPVSGALGQPVEALL